MVLLRGIPHLLGNLIQVVSAVLRFYDDSVIIRDTDVGVVLGQEVVAVPVNDGRTVAELRNQQVSAAAGFADRSVQRIHLL